MKTRSQTKYENSAKYDVTFDFDAASAAWKANKKSIGNGSYKYVCCELGKNNDFCNRKCLAGENYCKTHLRMCKDKEDQL